MKYLNTVIALLFSITAYAVEFQVPEEMNHCLERGGTYVISVTDNIYTNGLPTCVIEQKRGRR